MSVLFQRPVSSALRIDRKKDKAERKILDSQERAFWDVHRPVVSYSQNKEKKKCRKEKEGYMVQLKNGNELNKRTEKKGCFVGRQF